MTSSPSGDDQPAGTALIVVADSADGPTELDRPFRDATIALADPATWPQGRFDVIVLRDVAASAANAEGFVAALTERLAADGTVEVSMSPAGDAAGHEAAAWSSYAGFQVLGSDWRTDSLVTRLRPGAGGSDAPERLALAQRIVPSLPAPAGPAPVQVLEPPDITQKQARQLRKLRQELTVTRRERDHLANSRAVVWSRRLRPGGGRKALAKRGLVVGAAALAAVLLAIWMGIGVHPAAGVVALLLLALAGLTVRSLRHLLATLARIERRQGRQERQLVGVRRLADRQQRQTGSTLKRLRKHRELTRVVAGDARMAASAADTAARGTEALRKELLGQFASHRQLREYAQIQATVDLYQRFAPAAAVPTMRGWAASPDAMLALLDELLRVRPAVVLECGSGVSTLWTALAIRKYDLPTRIVSLEHLPQFAEATRATLLAHGVDDLVDLRVAPLTDAGLPGHDTPWYDRSALADLDQVGLVFIDGPPEALGPESRWPALPAVLPTLADRVSLVLDDAVRPAEKRAVSRWLTDYPDFTAVYLHTEKGTSILRRGH